MPGTSSLYSQLSVSTAYLAIKVYAWHGTNLVKWNKGFFFYLDLSSHSSFLEVSAVAVMHACCISIAINVWVQSYTDLADRATFLKPDAIWLSI